MPAPHHPVFYRLDALPATQPTAKALKATQKIQTKPYLQKTTKINL